MFFEELPIEINAHISEYLDNDDIKKLICLNSSCKAIFTPILEKRRKALIKLYICKELFIYNDNYNAYTERYFEFAAMDLKTGAIFTVRKEAEQFQVRKGPQCGLYIVHLPYDSLVINSNQIQIQADYQLKSSNIEGFYFHPFRVGKELKRNVECTRFGKELSLGGHFLTTKQEQAAERGTMAVKEHNKKRKTCTLS